MTRNQLFDVFAASNVVTISFEYHTDDNVERAYQYWVQQGEPKQVVLSMDGGGNTFEVRPFDPCRGC